MAINLNPGADSTLVTAATRAGLATVPEDYSKTFQSVADSYDKTMEANAKVWKSITDVVALVGIDMVENAKEFMDYRVKGAGLNPDSAKFLVSELEANKQEQKDLGFLGGTFGNKETRQRKAELKIKQAEIFADIDMAAESINAGAEAVAGNLYDFRLAPYESEMINAIIKSNLKDKTTKAGNTAVLSRDEKTDELMFTLLGEGGKPMDPPQTMTIKEFNKSIATNVTDTKNATGQALNTLNNNIASAGAKSTSGVYDPQMKQMNLNNLDALTSTPTDLKRAMLTKFGYSNTSFYDDITSGAYPDLYASLLKSTGSKREIAIEHSVVEGIEDADGNGFISQEEIANDYGVLSANILGMKNPEVSREYFKEYTSKKLEEAFKYGYSKRPPKPGSGTGTDSKLDFYSKGKKIERLGNKGYMSGGTATGIYNKIQAGKNFDAQDPITGETNNYSYQNIGDDTGWYENYQKGDDKSSVQYIGLNGGDVGKKFTNDLRWHNITTTVEEEVNEFGEVINKPEQLSGTYDKKTGLSVSDLEQDDNLVVTRLNETIPAMRTTANQKGYHFDITRNIFGIGEFTQDAVVLLDGNNNPVVFPDGHKHAGKQASFYTDQSKEADKQASFNYLMDIMEHFKLNTGGNTTNKVDALINKYVKK